MKLSQSFKLVTLAAPALLNLVSACGVYQPAEQTQESTVNFIQTSAKKALLEQKDLDDEFVFGLSVIEVSNFFTKALMMSIDPMRVKLIPQQEEDGSLKLYVASLQNKPMLTFGMKELTDGNLEVDFSTAGNDISMYNQLGALHSVENPTQETQAWKTVGAPTVTKIDQSADTIVADILHKVSYTLPEAPEVGAQTRTGTVKFRIFLARQKKLPQVPAGQKKTVGQAKALKLGYFPAEEIPQVEANLPINRFPVNTTTQVPGQITVYLKDFPENMLQSATGAVLSWNIAFGFNAIRVQIAPSNVDLGDPRFHVIKWFDGLDKEVPWAGIAPQMTNPITGYVLGAQIMINGNTSLEGMRKMVQFSQAAAPHIDGILQGHIGNIPVVQGAGETPVTTFLADLEQVNNPEQYLKDYYRSVIMHEFGHALGLRHNFAASTKLDLPYNLPSSVMDYEPNWSTARRTEPGSYDKAAIQWAYLNKIPAAGLVFCTDGDMKTRLDCNQGDLGDPANYSVATIMNGVTLLKALPVAFGSHVKTPMQGALMNMLKVKNLIYQLPVNRRTTVLTQIEQALEMMRTAQPVAGLSPQVLAIVTGNLAKVKKTYESVLNAPAAPNALVAGE